MRQSLHHFLRHSWKNTRRGRSFIVRRLRNVVELDHLEGTVEPVARFILQEYENV